MKFEFVQINMKQVSYKALFLYELTCHKVSLLYELKFLIMYILRVTLARCSFNVRN